MRTSSRLATSLFGAFALVAACGGQTADTLPPTGQIVLFVTTDAPLPPPVGVPLRADETPPLFDRLRIELFAPGEKTPCRDCTREFPLDREQVKKGEVSFGFVPKPSTPGYVARLQLYRAIAVRQGAPISGAAITRYVSLPKVTAEGIVTIGSTLHVDDVGQPKGALDAPVLADEGRPDFNLVGSWPGAVRVKCKGTPQADEVCVPGGAYWMGDPTRGSETPQFEVGTPRLVVLSPFFIDKTEVTVATYRASKLARVDDKGTSVDPFEAENRGTALEFNFDVFGACTFTQTPGVKRAQPRRSYDACGVPGDLTFVPHYAVTATNPAVTDADYETSIMNRNTDALPVTCLSWAKATQYCRALGRDLPTAAQYEFLSGGFASHYYPWGDADPSCEDAVFERSQTTDARCRAEGTLGSPLAPGSGKLDRIKLDTGEVVDIAGNVAELTRDAWNRPNESCWTPSLLHDPVCAKPTVDDAESDTCAPHPDPAWGATPIQPHAPYMVKGGAWTTQAFYLRAANNDISFPYAISAYFGFRCGREDK